MTISSKVVPIESARRKSAVNGSTQRGTGKGLLSTATKQIVSQPVKKLVNEIYFLLRLTGPKNPLQIAQRLGVVDMHRIEYALIALTHEGLVVSRKVEPAWDGTTRRVYQAVVGMEV